MSTSTDTSTPLSLKVRAALHVAVRSNWIISVVAVIIAFIVGAFFIWIADASIIDTYWRLFKGSIFDPDQDTFARQIRPLTNTFMDAAPLILAGLGLGLGFRAGLFNIGGQGQIILGAIAATYLGFHPGPALRRPPSRRSVGAVIVAGIWGGFVGLAQGKNGCERGDRDDHAELDRPFPPALRLEPGRVPGPEQQPAEVAGGCR